MRPFFLPVHPKGKRNQQPQQKPIKTHQDKRKDKARQQAGKTRTKSIKAAIKQEKRKANTPQAIKPPNCTRAQKPHKPRKAPKQYKTTSNKRNPLKTALKREIKAYSGLMHRKQSSKADKRQGTRQNGGHQDNFANSSKIARKQLHTCTS